MANTDSRTHSGYPVKTYLSEMTIISVALLSPIASTGYERYGPATVPSVEWKVIRAAFIRARGRRKQEEIAQAGGLYQSAISKLESNDKLGPAVEVFIKAIEGLGMRPSQFFAELERSPNPPLKGEPKAGQDPTATTGGPHGDLVSAVVPYVLYELSDQLLKAADRTLAPRPVSSPRPGQSKRR